MRSTNRQGRGSSLGMLITILQAIREEVIMLVIGKEKGSELNDP